MTTPELMDQEPAELPKSKPGFGYYKMANGDVTVDVVSPMERMHYMEEGWKYLPQYGTFDMTSGYAANNPFELLFMRGGAAELSIEQVIANGFHVKPPQIPRCRKALDQTHKMHRTTCWPATDVTFPQLDGANTLTYPCKFESCNRSNPDQALPTASALRRHEMVMHKEETGDIRTGTVLANALLAGFAGNAPKVIADAGFTANQRTILEAAGIIIVKKAQAES